MKGLYLAYLLVLLIDCLPVSVNEYGNFQFSICTICTYDWYTYRVVQYTIIVQTAEDIPAATCFMFHCRGNNDHICVYQFN